MAPYEAFDVSRVRFTAAPTHIPRMIRFLLLLLLLVAPVARAQVVETPVAFDSAGRVMAVTPSIAARVQLGPPAWRVVGDYTDARLFSLGGDAYVLAVTRRDGSVERYSLTALDVAYLRERVSTLPPQFEIRRPRGERGGFILTQSLLGLAVYAPAFAAAVTDNDAGSVSAYLLVSGATFFAASQIARDYTVTPAMWALSTHGAVHGAFAGAAIPYILGAGDDNDEAGYAGMFAGGLAGTAAGLVFGNRMTTSDAVAAGFGADVSLLTMLGIVIAAKGEAEEDDVYGDRSIDELNRGEAALLLGAAAAGYPLGYLYPRTARYNVTAGDVLTLWVTGALGVATSSIFLIDNDPSVSVGALALTSGFLGGIAAGDRLLVKRFDHSAGDAGLLAVGGAAGALMGFGISNLLGGTDDARLNVGIGTAAAALGVAATHYYIAPGGDEGRFSSNIRFTPAGAAFAAARVPGRYPLLSVSF